MWAGADSTQVELRNRINSHSSSVSVSHRHVISVSVQLFYFVGVSTLAQNTTRLRLRAYVYMHTAHHLYPLVLVLLPQLPLPPTITSTTPSSGLTSRAHSLPLRSRAPSAEPSHPAPSRSNSRGMCMSYISSSRVKHKAKRSRSQWVHSRENLRLRVLPSRPRPPFVIRCTPRPRATYYLREILLALATPPRVNPEACGLKTGSPPLAVVVPRRAT